MASLISFWLCKFCSLLFRHTYMTPYICCFINTSMSVLYNNPVRKLRYSTFRNWFGLASSVRPWKKKICGHLPSPFSGLVDWGKSYQAFFLCSDAISNQICQVRRRMFHVNCKFNLSRALGMKEVRFVSIPPWWLTTKVTKCSFRRFVRSMSMSLCRTSPGFVMGKFKIP